MNKVVFITGSAKRLGAYTAKYLHAAGYDVVVHCHHSVDAANALVAELNRQRSHSAALVRADLCQISALRSLADNVIAAFGRIDVLINNASAFYPTPMGEISIEDWHALMGSNAQAPLFLTQLFQKQLTENQGVVINMADIHAQTPLKSHTLYCMAKAALVMMTQSLAQELAPHVRVNAIAPGAILWPENPLNDEDKHRVMAQIPLNKMGQENDIAQAIAFLINASYVTGQILAVDGGRSIANSSIA